MALRPTKLSELAETILVRPCWIEAPDGEVTPLTVSFLRPRRIDDGTVEGAVRFACKHFDKVLTLFAGDDVQAFALLLHGGRTILEIEARNGFSIWFTEKGDLGFFDFWSYQERLSEFCLPSAYNGPARDAFDAANEGKFLMPSHRVAIEPDRPGITTYVVQPDGTDVVDGLIGPDDLKMLQPEELCRRLGEMLLLRTPEGRKLLGLSHLEPPPKAKSPA